MSLRKLFGGSSAAMLCAGLASASLGGLCAIMPVTSVDAAPYIQQVDCAVGAHIGPLGACILGSDPQPTVVETRPAPVVVEHPPADPQPPTNGCSSTSVNRTDAVGNSETKTRTEC
jgi:hypothetical protein